ncbi:hypothetical protein GB937_007710 [Aspergillus fischeri]|nr:hypothetical protein GB937_007710 [Aspergillus fischeri]
MEVQERPHSGSSRLWKQEELAIVETHQQTLFPHVADLCWENVLQRTAWILKVRNTLDRSLDWSDQHTAQQWLPLSAEPPLLFLIIFNARWFVEMCNDPVPILYRQKIQGRRYVETTFHSTLRLAFVDEFKCVDGADYLLVSTASSLNVLAQTLSSISRTRSIVRQETRLRRCDTSRSQSTPAKIRPPGRSSMQGSARRLPPRTSSPALKTLTFCGSTGSDGYPPKKR